MEVLVGVMVVGEKDVVVFVGRLEVESVIGVLYDLSCLMFIV